MSAVAAAAASGVPASPRVETASVPAARAGGELSGVVAPIVTRFPVAWLARLTGDCIRVVTTVRDYGRKSGECWASDQTIADQLGLSRGGVNRLIAKAEAADLVRSEYSSRTGTQARRVRPMREGELAVCVSARARANLAGNRFKVYAALSFREHLGEATSVAQLARMCGIAAETARAVAADLVADGWVSREGTEGGAFRYTVHAAPLAGVATQVSLFPQPQQTARAAAGEACAEDGEDLVAGGVCAGQLELFGAGTAALPPLDSVTATPPDSVTATPLDSVTQTGSLDQDLVNRQGVVSGCGSRVADRSVPREAVENPSAPKLPATRSEVVAPSADPRKTSTLPSLTVSPEVYAVLSMVPLLVARMNRWQQRQAAKAIGQAIRETGGDAGRIADRLMRRYAPLETSEIRDAYAWLVHRGLTHRGCQLPSCEDGTDMELGGKCHTCQYQREGAQTRATLRRQAQRELPASSEETTAPQNRPRPLAAVPQPTAAPAPQRRTCPMHQETVMPCGLCTSLADARPTPKAKPDEPCPESTPDWMAVDNSEGIAFREQLTARRRVREEAAGAGPRLASAGSRWSR
jgi:hypothetical protein